MATLFPAFSRASRALYYVNKTISSSDKWYHTHHLFSNHIFMYFFTFILTIPFPKLASSIICISCPSSSVGWLPLKHLITVEERLHADVQPPSVERLNYNLCPKCFIMGIVLLSNTAALKSPCSGFSNILTSMFASIIGIFFIFFSSRVQHNYYITKGQQLQGTLKDYKI